MKVALEIGETLEVAILEENRVVSTLSLTLRAPGVTRRVASDAPAKSSASAPASKGGRKRRAISPEGRARMATAQKARWAARKAKANQSNENQG